MPCVIQRLAARKTITIGICAEHDGGSRERERREVLGVRELQQPRRDRQHLLGAQERQCEDEFLPDADEVEQEADGNRGQAQRDDHVTEHRHVAAAVDVRGVLDVARKARQEAGQDQQLQREAEGRVDRNQAGARVEHPRVVEQPVERDQDCLLGQHQRRQQEHEDRAPADQAQAAEGVRRHDGEQRGDERAEAGVEQAVLEQRAEVEHVPRGAIGVEADRVRERERVVDDLVLGLERREQREEERVAEHRRDAQRQQRPSRLARVQAHGAPGRVTPRHRARSFPPAGGRRSRTPRSARASRC